MTQIIAAVLILCLLGFIISLFNSESNSSGPSPRTSSPKKTVKTEIRVVSDGIMVSNADTNAWQVITLFVNSDPPFGYHCTIGPVNPLASKVIPLREFAKDNSERFNPFANKVVKVWIGGGDYDYEAYGF